jgi:hypothetical protein
MEFIQKLATFCKSKPYFREPDFLELFQTEDEEKAFRRAYRARRNQTIETFAQTANDWQAFAPAVVMGEAIQYGLVPSLPEGLITSTGGEGESFRQRFVYKVDGVEDYLEGEEYSETYIEGASYVGKYRKPGAKIVQTYEAIKDLPLSLLTTNVSLTMQEFRAREWKHFTHELHKSTSNKYETHAQDKHGNPLVDSKSKPIKWRTFFDNVYTPDGADKWDHIKGARHKMLNKDRDAVRPNVCITNATTEAELSDDDKVNLAHIFGGANTYFREGTLPSIYSLQFVIVPDAYHGYFENDVTRKNDEFVKTNDIFLTTTNNGPTILRYTREPLSTETWRIYDGQREAMNLWERYALGCYRFTNVMRIPYPHTNLSGASVTLE